MGTKGGRKGAVGGRRRGQWFAHARKVSSDLRSLKASKTEGRRLSKKGQRGAYTKEGAGGSSHKEGELGPAVSEGVEDIKQKYIGKKKWERKGRGRGAHTRKVSLDQRSPKASKTYLPSLSSPLPGQAPSMCGRYTAPVWP